MAARLICAGVDATPAHRRSNPSTNPNPKINGTAAQVVLFDFRRILIFDKIELMIYIYIRDTRIRNGRYAFMLDGHTGAMTGVRYGSKTVVAGTLLS